MTAVDFGLDLSVLEEIDFPTPCQHSWHSKGDSDLHSGPAEWIVQALHMCPGDTEQTVYACCTPWKNHVLWVNAKEWVVCATCDERMPGNEWVIVLGPLKGW
jgi:hypothetical protein